jgi:hypothetical protein
LPCRAPILQVDSGLVEQAIKPRPIGESRKRGSPAHGQAPIVSTLTASDLIAPSTRTNGPPPRGGTGPVSRERSSEGRSRSGLRAHETKGKQAGRPGNGRKHGNSTGVRSQGSLCCPGILTGSHRHRRCGTMVVPLELAV